LTVDSPFTPIQQTNPTAYENATVYENGTSTQQPIPVLDPNWTSQPIDGGYAAQPFVTEQHPQRYLDEPIGSQAEPYAQIEQFPTPVAQSPFAVPAPSPEFDNSQLPIAVPTSSMQNDVYVSTDLDAVAPPAQPVSLPNPDSIELDPWWNQQVMQPMRCVSEETYPVDLDTLIWLALSHSPKIQSVLTTPLIRQAEINEAWGIFDRTRFVESIFNDTNDPVGNLLTTGGAPRLKEHFLDSKAGVRGQNRYGGQTEFNQSMGLRNNNSQFFEPKQQADAKMVLRYTQPLRKGAGTFYNYSSIAIAQAGASVSEAESRREIQLHVYDICQAYWNVFYNRSVLLQGNEALKRLESIASSIAARAEIDGTQSQAARARAAVSNQRARVQRASADLIQAEANLNRLVAAPELRSPVVREIIPTALPLNSRIQSDVTFELALALEQRPEIMAIRDQIRGSRIQQKVAENELRSTLNLVTETYIRGLNGDYDVSDSFGDQFARGRPSYSAGLTYQRPKNNTAAAAINRQRNLQIRQLLFTLDDELRKVTQDVESSAADLEASFGEYRAAVDSTLATNQEVGYLVDRWKSNPFVDNTNTSLLLDQILDAESRLIQSENGWALAQTNYMISIARARLAAGSILSIEIIDPSQEVQNSINPQTPMLEPAPIADEAASLEPAPIQ
jgi:outer membrane protein